MGYRYYSTSEKKSNRQERTGGPLYVLEEFKFDGCIREAKLLRCTTRIEFDAGLEWAEPNTALTQYRTQHGPSPCEADLFTSLNCKATIKHYQTHTFHTVGC